MRRWWVRAAAAVVLFGVAETGLAVLDAHADPVRLALLAALTVAGGALVLDAVPLVATGWAPAAPDEVRLTRIEAGTAAHLRVLESHLTSRTVDDGLRLRLRELADRALRTRHDTGIDDPRAPALLGPELTEVLGEAGHRLGVDDIERCVRRIEEL